MITHSFTYNVCFFLMFIFWVSFMRIQIPWQLLQSEFFLGTLLCRLCFRCMAFSFFQLYLDFWLNITSSLFTHQLILADASFWIGKLCWFCFLLWWAFVLPYPFHSVHIWTNFFGCVNALHYCYSSSDVVHFSCIVYLFIFFFFLKTKFCMAVWKLSLSAPDLQWLTVFPNLPLSVQP